MARDPSEREVSQRTHGARNARQSVQVGELNPPDTSIDGSCGNVMTGPYDDKLPVPTLLFVEADDNNARISWGPKGDSPELDSVLDKGIAGFRVCWGKSGEAPKHGALFTQRIGQLFGVQNGMKYTAYIQTVDSFGHVSKPTPPIEFTGDPARVDALSKKMTGFFDDFNKPGPLDELKWNVAYSQCNDPLVSAAFVTEDLRAVTVGGTESFLHEGVGTFCDRLQVVARPRAIFDFTNREGVIAFDFDGSFGLRESGTSMSCRKTRRWTCTTSPRT